MIFAIVLIIVLPLAAYQAGRKSGWRKSEPHWRAVEWQDQFFKQSHAQAQKRASIARNADGTFKGRSA